jgi:RimJ/RimL family protein N-acetyltransferase
MERATMSEEVKLRASVPDDAPHWYRWRNEGVDSFVDGLPFSFENHRRWFEAKLGDPHSRLWTVVFADQPVGMLGFTQIDHRQQTAELAWVFVEAQRRGIGSRAVSAALHLSFGELNLHRIYLTVLADNGRAIRCYEKAGFRTEGRLRDAVFKAGARRDLMLMAVLRSDTAG